MSKKKMKTSIVEESIFGVYVWLTPQGQKIMDSDGNVLCIQSIKGNKERIENLRRVAKEVGVEGGFPYFISGARQVTDEEYEYQKQRMEWGLIPDELDLAAFKEEHFQLEEKKKRGISTYDEDFD